MQISLVVYPWNNFLYAILSLSLVIVRSWKCWIIYCYWSRSNKNGFYISIKASFKSITWPCIFYNFLYFFYLHILCCRDFFVEYRSYICIDSMYKAVEEEKYNWFHIYLMFSFINLRNYHCNLLFQAEYWQRKRKRNFFDRNSQKTKNLSEI